MWTKFMDDSANKSCISTIDKSKRGGGYNGNDI